MMQPPGLPAPGSTQPLPQQQFQQQQSMMQPPPIGQFRPTMMQPPPTQPPTIGGETGGGPPTMPSPPQQQQQPHMVPNGSVPTMGGGQIHMPPQQYGEINHGGPQQQPFMRPSGLPGPPTGMPGMMPPGMQHQQHPPGVQPYPAGQMPPFDQNLQQPQQQQQRMDVDQIPNPIEVAQANAAKYAGGEVFESNEAGKIPPLVTTEFVCKDGGNCNPRFMRSTIYSVPNNPDLLKQSKLPFVLALTPFAQLKNGEVS